MPAPERLREAVRERVFPEAPRADARAVARAIVGSGGGRVAGVVFFGSRKTQARPGPGSAWDVFVLTRDYWGFYRALAAGGKINRSHAVLAALNTALPPNQVSFEAHLDDGSAARAKCAVITLARFQQETSALRHDHFLLGRLFQPVEVVYAADEEASRRILDALVSAHTLTFDWVRPWLPPRFDLDTYCRTLLTVSFAREVRPEPALRTEALWQAQESYLRPVYGELLRERQEAGELEESPPGFYTLTHPVTAGERWRAAAYFRWSEVRATTRWAKYVVTFEGWLDFIVGKAERHTGQEIVLTPRERRFPLVFLWPRFFRYLRHKDGKGSP